MPVSCSDNLDMAGDITHARRFEAIKMTRSKLYGQHRASVAA